MDVEKTIEFILEQQANSAVLQAKVDETLNRVSRRLDRAVKLGVKEARNERKRRQELDARVTAAHEALAAAQATEAAASAALDEKITQLTAAQLVSEEKWQSFMDFMRRGGNGSH
jgi:hypothetical protein